MFFGLMLLLLLGLVIALLVRVEKTAGRLTYLEFRVGQLEKRASPHGAPASAPAPSPVPSKPADSISLSPASTDIAPPAVLSPVPGMERQTLAPPMPAPSRSKEEWESLIGGKLLNRIGALALIIGVGFFLKYAFDNNWINETFRVLLGGAAGVALLFLAARAHRKGFEIFSQGLVGAGIAILYLSVFASFNFYRLVSQPVAFIIMAGVTVVAFTQAFRYNSMAVALLGWGGGFLTPFLLGTGESNEAGLFTYVALLDVGILLVRIRKDRWIALEPLCLTGTFILFFTWYAEYYTADALAITILFLALFWGLFHGLDLYLERGTPAAGWQMRRLVAWANWFLTTVSLSIVVSRLATDSLPTAYAPLALLYAASAAIFIRSREEMTSPFLHYSLAAAILVALAIGWQFEKFALPIAWTAEAAILFWLGTALRRDRLWQAGAVILLTAMLGLFNTAGAFSFQPIGSFRPLWNERAMAFVVVALGCATGSTLLRRQDRPYQAEIFQYGWILLLLVLITVEISDIFLAVSIGTGESARSHALFLRLLTHGAAWGAYGLALLGASRMQYRRPLFFGGIWILLIGMLLASLRGIAYTPLEHFSVLLNVRVAAILFVVLVGALALGWLKELQSKTSWASRFRSPLRIAIAGALILLLTGETHDAFQKAIVEASRGNLFELTDRLQNLEQLSLSGVWLLYSIGLMGFGLWRRLRPLRILAIILFGCTILKIFIYDLSFLDTLYRFTSFIALGLILLAVSYLYQRYRAIVFGPSSE
jgi:uncharacterized membrane protein